MIVLWDGNPILILLGVCLGFILPLIVYYNTKKYFLMYNEAIAKFIGICVAIAAILFVIYIPSLAKSIGIYIPFLYGVATGAVIGSVISIIIAHREKIFITDKNFLKYSIKYINKHYNKIINKGREINTLITKIKEEKGKNNINIKVIKRNLSLICKNLDDIIKEFSKINECLKKMDIHTLKNHEIPEEKKIKNYVKEDKKIIKVLENYKNEIENIIKDIDKNKIEKSKLESIYTLLNKLSNNLEKITEREIKEENNILKIIKNMLKKEK